MPDVVADEECSSTSSTATNESGGVKLFQRTDSSGAETEDKRVSETSTSDKSIPQKDEVRRKRESFLARLAAGNVTPSTLHASKPDVVPQSPQPAPTDGKEHE